MTFEWDPAKAAINVRKHGIDFADAAAVVFDELALTVVDESEGEERLATIGVDALGRTLVVIWAWHGENVRTISARMATRHERRQYEEGP
jgi:hypothetical protein